MVPFAISTKNGIDPGRLSGLASQALGRRLFPRSAEAIAPAPYYQRDYRADWMSATPYERGRLAERIGNQGRAIASAATIRIRSASWVNAILS